MLKTIIFSTIVVSCSALAIFSTSSDEVHELPGLSDKLNFRHFSGYLQGKDPNNLLHYWFVESQNDPSTDPLVLWMNGGPGCSSIGGMLGEHGPFFIQNDGRTLKLNPNSWNLKANVIYLEAPVGVGYSFNTKTTQYPTDDDKTAQDNYAALKSFFKKFPQYLKHDFFIAGESYGGVYVPTLATLVADGTFPIKFQGMLIGNGLLDDDKNGISTAFYYYGHGFIDEQTFRDVANKCCGGSFDLTKCKMIGSCGEALGEAGSHIGPQNPYNVYQKCPNPLAASSDAVQMRSLTSKESMRSYFIAAMSKCMNITSYADYLNQPSVRKAIHIDPRAAAWSLCSPIPYTSQYSNMKRFVEHLVTKIRVLFYNGDFDTVCNYLGDEWFASDLDLKVIKAKHPYLQDNLTAGYKTIYQNLTFATVKGAGHMVPSDQPKVILRIMQAFLRNEDF